ncbi:MAG: putative DNA binding domain-containing protein [Spirochaetaceae bacterium]|nr:putative DNA binding domain-containing protein [Spirochaetaceae bacterium]
MAEPERIEVLLRDLVGYDRETEWIEFKVDNDKPSDIGEYLSALSNAARMADQPFGYLCFGVENATHRIVGTTTRLDEARVGGEPLEPWLARLLEPRVDFTLQSGEIDGNKVFVVTVAAARGSPTAFSGVEYLRIGPHNKKLKAYPEREAKLWGRLRGATFEGSTAEDCLDDEGVLSRLDVGGFFELVGQSIPDRAYMFDRLEKERVIRRSQGRWEITNMGAVLFAKDLRQFAHLVRKAVRVIQYRGKGRVETVAEQEGRKGYALGYSGLIAYIMDRLGTGEVIEQGLRRSGAPYPEILVREIVANAIIHQDFEISGAGPMIELFDDRIEITNPGVPIISPLRFIDHPPRSRNEQLASFMRRVSICEERGSGIDKAVTALEGRIMPPLRFVQEEDFFKVVIQSARPFRDLEADDRIAACYQHCCLRHAENSAMTNKTLRERFGIEEKNYSMVSRVITDAKAAGLVKDADPENRSRRDARYVPFYA